MDDDNSGSAANEALARALLQQQQIQYDRSLAKLCKRLKIELVTYDDAVQRLFMWAEIGKKLAKTQSEFTKNVRGGQRKSISKPMEIARDLEDFRRELGEDGAKLSDRTLLKILLENKAFSIDVRSTYETLLGQAARGKRDLKAFRDRLNRAAIAN